MKGTEKQIAWAEKIMAEKARKFDIMLNSMTEMAKAEGNYEGAKPFVEKTRAYIDAHKDEAKFWIDHRDLCDLNSSNMIYGQNDFMKSQVYGDFESLLKEAMGK